MAQKADGTVYINSLMDTSGFKAGSKEIESTAKRMAKRVGGVIAAILSVRELVKFGKEAVELGSALSEVQNVVDVTFGSLSKEVDDFAKKAITQFGLSETAAKQYTSTMGAMLKSMGLTTREAADMSMSMTGLAADMASFYNITSDEAFYKIRAGISGETEPLKQLGINMSVANLEAYALSKGIKKSYNAMTQQEQAVLRYNYLLSVTADAQGDFARTSESWANQTRVLSEQFKAIKTTIGQGLINVLTPVLKVINTILARLATLANAFKSFTELVTGNKSSGSTGAAAAGLGTADMTDGYNEAAEGAENLASATEDAADATKDAEKAAKGYLSPLDEINKFQTDADDLADDLMPDLDKSLDSESPFAGGELQVDYGNLAEGETIIDEISDKLLALKDIWDGILKPFKLAWEEQGKAVTESAKGAFDSIKDTLADIGSTLYSVWTSGTGQEYVESVLNLFRSILDVIRAISDAFRTAWNDDGNGYKLIESFFNMLTNINNMLAEINDSFSKAFSSGVGVSIMTNLLQIATGLFNIIGNLAERFTEAWNTAGLGDSIMQGILEIIDTILGTINEIVSATADWAAKLDFTPLLTSIDNLLKSIQPLAQNIGDGLAWFYEHVLLPLAGFVIEDVIPRFFETLGNVLDILNAVLEALQPLFQWFWDSILQPIAEWTGGVFLSVWDGINSALKAFSDWCKENPESIQNIAIILGSFAAAVGIVTGAITLWNTVGAIAAGVTTALGTAISFLVSPIGIAIMAITAIIAVGVLLYKNWDTIKEKAGQLKDWLVQKFEAIKTGVIEKVEFLKTKVSNAWTAITTTTSTTWENVKSTVSSKAKQILSTVTTKFSSISSKAKKFGTDTISGITKGFSESWHSLTQWVQSIWDGIVKKFDNIRDWMANVGVNIVNGIIDGISRAWNALKSWAQSIFDLFTFNIGGGGGNSGGGSGGIIIRTVPTVPTFPVPDIPYLAKGAVIPPNAPFMAILGDQKRGDNLEMPEELLRKIIREEVGKTQQKGNQSYHFTAQINRKTLFDEVIDEAVLRQTVYGRNPFELG